MSALALIVAAIELVAPKADAVVPLVPDVQKAVLSKATLAEREAVFAADRKNGKVLRHSKEWRQARPVVLEWKATAGEKGPWEIVISKNADLSGARVDCLDKRTVTTNAAGNLRYELPLANLEIATKYYWRVTSDITCGKYDHGRNCGCPDARRPVASAVASFVTEDLAPRWIAISGEVGNFRDLGGRIGYGGKRVRQGLIYRGQGLNANSVDGVRKGRNRLTVSDIELLTQDLGIKTDLDLRNSRETAKMKTSPLGPTVRFVHHSSSCYRGIFEAEGKKVMAENFRLFCDRANYPIYFHCIGGADRTGSLGYVLNGVLGVSRQELETDWESTFYPKIPDQVHPEPDFWCRESHFNDGFSKYGKAGDSWNRRIELYLQDCGITAAEIEAFRSIMLK